MFLPLNLPLMDRNMSFLLVYVGRRRVSGRRIIFFHRGYENPPFFVLCPNVFYAIISVSGPLGGKSYIRTLDTMIFSLGYRFNPRAKPSG